MKRRLLIEGGAALGALGLLTGCDVSSESGLEQALLAVSRMNDRVQQWLFDPAVLAPVFSASEVLTPPKFNAYYPIEKVKPVDGATWRLEMAGRVTERRPWNSADLAALPQRDEIIQHVCVEGWSYIGQWGGPTLRSVLERVGADLTARYVAFRTADDFNSSIDMATALHPQTLLATSYAGAPLADPFGFPCRLRMSTKLGFKNPKWITAIEVTNIYPGGYWEDRGFNWFAGL